MTHPESIEHGLRHANRLADAEQFDAAIDRYRALLTRDPRCTAAWFNLGRTLQDAERYEESAASYLKAIELEPGFRDAGLNLGIVLRILGRTDDAVSLFDELIHADPDDAQAHLQRSLTRLAAGDFAVGWDEYTWRWKAEARPQRQFDRPAWDGSELPGTLLVTAEQGVGDEIQFASCLPDVLQRVGHCILECEPRLVPLFARSFPTIDAVPTTVSRNDFDAHVSIGDLPRLFRRSSDDFPEGQSWLVANPAAVEHWKSRFATLGDGPTIGVAWRGGCKPAVRHSRSTPLASWRPVLQTPNVKFVNLQHGDVSEELGELKEAVSGAGVDPLRDLDGFAALVAALDLVISVDNSTVHLAGALGVPVWTLLPFAADFRWMQSTDRSPWYPTMRLFRQRTPGDWDDVIQNAARDLESVSNP